MRFVTTSLLAYGTSVTAVGIAVLLNNSTSPIYAWSVGGVVGPRHDIKAGNSKLQIPSLALANISRWYLLGRPAP
jgi:hypothetical protein